MPSPTADPGGQGPGAQLAQSRCSGNILWIRWKRKQEWARPLHKTAMPGPRLRQAGRRAVGDGQRWLPCGGACTERSVHVGHPGTCPTSLLPVVPHPQGGFPGKPGGAGSGGLSSALWLGWVSWVNVGHRGGRGPALGRWVGGEQQGGQEPWSWLRGDCGGRVPGPVLRGKRWAEGTGKGTKGIPSLGAGRTSSDARI